MNTATTTPPTVAIANHSSADVPNQSSVWQNIKMFWMQLLWFAWVTFLSKVTFGPIVMPLFVLASGSSSNSKLWTEIFTYHLPVLLLGFFIGRSGNTDRCKRFAIQLFFIVGFVSIPLAVGQKTLPEASWIISLFTAILASGWLIGSRFEKPMDVTVKDAEEKQPLTNKEDIIQFFRMIGGIAIPIVAIIALKVGGAWLGGVAQAKLYNQKPAPPTVFSMTDETPWTFANHHGKVILVEYWSPSCGPCLASFPYLKNLHERYADRKDFQMVSVSAGGSEERAIAIFEQYECSWPLLFEHAAIQEEDFDPYYVPAAFVIDQQGTVVGSSLGFLEAEQLIESLLNDTAHERQ